MAATKRNDVNQDLILNVSHTLKQEILQPSWRSSKPAEAVMEHG